MREPITHRRQLGVTTLLLTALAACGEKSEAQDGTPQGGAGAGSDQATLHFAAIPDNNRTALEERYGKVASYLSKELGVPVEFVPTVDYAASVEGFKNGDIQLAWFGGLTGVQAWAAVPGARAIVMGKVDPDFKSYFIAHKDAGIEASDEFPMALEGKTFTFGPANSTSGRLMPEHFIRENTGKSPEEFFGHPNKYATEGHDVTAMQVQAGTVQAGALNYKVYDDLVAKGKVDPAVCVKIWTTPPYADYNFTAHPDLEKLFGAGFTDKLQAALVGMTDPDLLAAMLRPEGLIPAKNEDFASVEKTARALDMVR